MTFTPGRADRPPGPRRRQVRRDPLIEHAISEGYDLDAETIACPVRIVWGTDDRLLPWPTTAARHSGSSLPHADWIELEGIGHCLQLDIPRDAAQLIVGFTDR